MNKAQTIRIPSPIEYLTAFTETAYTILPAAAPHEQPLMLEAYKLCAQVMQKYCDGGISDQALAEFCVAIDEGIQLSPDNSKVRAALDANLQAIPH